MFDFNVFNSEKLADAGATLHLVHPVTGDVVYVDDKQKKPCELILKGSDCDIYLEFQQKKLNERSKHKNDDKIDFKKNGTCLFITVYDNQPDFWPGNGNCCSEFDGNAKFNGKTSGVVPTIGATLCRLELENKRDFAQKFFGILRCFLC